MDIVAEGNNAHREEQVVDQAHDRGQPERPVAEAEPKVQQNGAPAGQDGIHGAGLRLVRQLAIERLQAIRLRPELEFVLQRF